MFNETPYKFGKKSLTELSNCHPDLQLIMNEVIKYRDCSVICGYRNEADQNKAFSEGKSKLKYPLSKHNKTPSLAVDVAPYPIDWKDMRDFADFVRFIQGLALGKFGIRIRAGLDFNGNWKYDDNFMDAPHLELHSKLINGVWTKYE